MIKYIGLVTIFIIAWQLINMGWLGWVNIKTMLGSKNRRPIDVSHLRPEAEPIDKSNIFQLSELGFQRLGEAQVKLPHRDPVSYRVLINSENNIVAQASSGMVSFSTSFREKIIIATDYPRGEHIETPTFQSHNIRGSIHETYQHHLKQVAKFRKLHGDPNTINNMVDYLKWDEVERTNYSIVKFKRYLWMDIFKVVVFIYGFIIIAGTPILYQAYLFPQLRLTQEQVELFIIGLIFPVILLPSLYTTFVMDNARESSEESS